RSRRRRRRSLPRPPARSPWRGSFGLGFKRHALLFLFGDSDVAHRLLAHCFSAFQIFTYFTTLQKDFRRQVFVAARACVDRRLFKAAPLGRVRLIFGGSRGLVSFGLLFRSIGFVSFRQFPIFTFFRGLYRVVDNTVYLSDACQWPRPAGGQSGSRVRHHPPPAPPAPQRGKPRLRRSSVLTVGNSVWHPRCVAPNRAFGFERVPSCEQGHITKLVLD